jgi:hypothetical protein
MLQKYTKLLVILTFLAMQFASILHVSESSDHDHDHENKDCSICYNYESQELSGSQSIEIRHNSFVYLEIFFQLKSQIVSLNNNSYFSRAPPYFS